MNSINVVSTTILTPQTLDISFANLTDFLIYLKQMCAFILGLKSLNSITMDRFFTNESSYDSIKRFIHDTRCKVLLVSNPSSECSSPFNFYALSNEIHCIEEQYVLLGLVKRNLVITNEDYHNQFQIINFIDPKGQEGLFGKLTGNRHINLPEIILTNRNNAVQTIKNVVDNIIQRTMDNNNRDRHRYDQDEDDNEMVMFKFAFTDSLDNVQRAHVYDAMIAYSPRTAAQNRTNTPCTIRRIADPNYAYQLGEQFHVLFNTQCCYTTFHAWLARTYSGCQHILTIIEPPAFSMNLVV